MRPNLLPRQPHAGKRTYRGPAIITEYSATVTMLSSLERNKFGSLRTPPRQSQRFHLDPAANLIVTIR
jgi:hypothetical protein